MFCCFSWAKSTKCSQNPGLVNEFSATPRGRLNWTGPIANGSETILWGNLPLPRWIFFFFPGERNSLSAVPGAWCGQKTHRCLKPCSPKPYHLSGKSTLWTNTGQDCNLQRTLSAIGPYEFRWGNSHGPIIGPYLFLGKFVWTNGPESFSNVSPYTGIGPWMALPSLSKFKAETIRKLYFFRKSKSCPDNVYLGEAPEQFKSRYV